MAATASSPSGFSYAQAARGHASTSTTQTTPNKVTSGTTTPATSTFSELGPNGNWADDVDTPAGGKMEDTKKIGQDQVKPAPLRDSMVERAKSEGKVQNGSSVVSSPDLTATPSTHANTDESSSSAANGTASDTTWETKSQNSEPAWIAERKERQSSVQVDENSRTKRDKNDSTEANGKASKETSPAPPVPAKPVVLHDAPPPAVNPWAKRMEVAKAKAPASAAVPALPKTSVSPKIAQTEDQRPRADSRKKANSTANMTYESDSRVSADAKKQASSQDTSASAGPGKTVQREHHSLPNLTSMPPPVKDELSWPTPEDAQEKEHKESSVEKDSKDADETVDGELSNGNKTHQKTKWKPIAVTPSIVWETEEMNRPPRGQNGERGGRGGNAARGRGGFRGTPAGSKGGDRTAAKNGAPPSDGLNDGEGAGTQRSRSETFGRDSIAPPQKPARSNDMREGKNSREQSSAERGPPAKSTHGVLGEDTASSDPRRNKSSKFDSWGEKVPEPIPRHSAAANGLHSSESVRDGKDAVHDGPTARRVPSENKKEARSFEGVNGKDWNSAPRGSKRNGRGRGGSREYANGHPSNSGGPNGHADFAANGYGVPLSPSPTAYQSPRGQYSLTQQGRGGWPRGNARSQSIPVENGFGNRSYWPPHQLAPMQTYYPGMYDYNGVPMSAIPYNPMIEHQYLLDMVTTQLEYYFSIDNLLKDMFLRKNMDSKGFVFLDVIANFNRIKQLTTDKELLKAGCIRSEHIEIRAGEDGKERLRKREGWDQFLLPKDQRETSAQTDGPSTLHTLEPPVLQFFPPQAAFRGPPSAGLPNSQRRSYDSGYQMNGAVSHFSPFSPMAEGAYGDLTNGEESRGRAAKSPIRGNSISPAQPFTEEFLDPKDQDADVFPNEHLSTLTVLVKMKQQHTSQPHAGSRTFSNGSIDTRNIIGELEKPVDEASRVAANSDSTVNGGNSHANAPRHPSPGLSHSPDKEGFGPEIFWVRGKELPQDNLPQGTTLENYLTLRDKALAQRAEAATGTCPYDLDVLYQFWSHFLIRNFNRNVYGEFKFHAHDDAQSRHSAVGLQNLVQFYAQALSSTIPIRDSIVRDYVELVKAEPSILRGAARKQLRQAWRNGALNLKNRKKLADIVDDALRLQLES